MQGQVHAHRSKLSFQYGFKVFLITVVVLVCSPPRVATAKGSGNPVKVLVGFLLTSAAVHTEYITLVESIGSNNYISSEYEEVYMQTGRYRTG